MSYPSKQERFELEKAFHNACLEGAKLDPLLHRNLQNRGDFYGEVDADRIPRKGILKFSAEFDYAKQSEFIPEERPEDRVGRDGKKYIANTSDQIPSGAIFVGEFIDGKPANGEYRWRGEIIEFPPMNEVFCKRRSKDRHQINNGKRKLSSMAQDQTRNSLATLTNLALTARALLSLLKKESNQ